MLVVDGGWLLYGLLVVLYKDGEMLLFVFDVVGLNCICEVFVVLVKCVVWFGIDVIEVYVVYGYLLY